MRGGGADDGVDDELGNREDRYRQKRGHQTQCEAESHDDRTGIPDNLEDRWHIAQSRKALSPSHRLRIRFDHIGVTALGTSRLPEGVARSAARIQLSSLLIEH